MSNRAVVKSFIILASLTFARSVANNSLLTFQVISGGNDNYFLRDNVTAAQLVLTNTNNTIVQARQFIVALPAGNSGALTYILPLNTDTSLSAVLVNGTFTSVVEDYNNTGVMVQLALNPNVTFGVTIIGAVRAMRDYVGGSGTMHDIFNYTLASYNSTFIQLRRQWINSTQNDPSTYRGADLYLSIPSGSTASCNVTPGGNATFVPPTIDIMMPPGGVNGTVQIKVVTNETGLTGLQPQSLFLPENTNETSGLQTVLRGLSSGNDTAANQVSFLMYSDKFTTGGWRFLTFNLTDSWGYWIHLRTVPRIYKDQMETMS